MYGNDGRIEAECELEAENTTWLKSWPNLVIFRIGEEEE